MKRYSIIFLLIVSLQQICIADSSKSVTPNYWHCQNFINSEPNSMIYTLYTKGDTLCNDIIYQKLFCLQDELFSNELYGEINSEPQGVKPIQNQETKNKHIGEIRFTGNNRQIYIYRNNKEYLLFDFDVKEGDTCRVYTGFDTIPDVKQLENGDDMIDLVVTKIYEEVRFYLLDGLTPIEERFRMIDLSGESHSGDKKYKSTWIDGIGSIYGLFPMMEYLSSDEPASSYLLCAWHEAQQLYQAPQDRFSFLAPSDPNPISVSCGGIVILDTQLNEVSYQLNYDLPMYNILGIKVGKEYKGIVIQNGKKFIKLN